MISLSPVTAPQNAPIADQARSGAGGWVAASSPSVEAELAALLKGAGVASLSDIGWLRVTGSDRVRWLNGMVTNSIQDLKPGQGCYNFVLNAQGWIQGDLTAFLLEDSILLETNRDQVEKLIAHLDHFIIMDDVELAISGDRAGLALVGPDAGKLLAAIDISSENGFEPLELAHVSWHSASIDLILANSPIVPRFELWSDAETVAKIDALLRQASAVQISRQTLEQLRILEGTARYGTDIRNSETARDLPQETGQTRALHFSKGCYLGQEIVERIRSRGNLHRTFSGFELHGALPEAGTTIEAGGKPVGELTSVAAIPLPQDLRPLGSAGPLQIALGYIRREALDRSLPLDYPGGIARPIALPYAILPYAIP
jgi:folate-binding protein YgfZ